MKYIEYIIILRLLMADGIVGDNSYYLSYKGEKVNESAEFVKEHILDNIADVKYNGGGEFEIVFTKDLEFDGLLGVLFNEFKAKTDEGVKE